ncbi:MAG: DnaA regulatory inactivator Hda [Gammaproteobacteria bacterium]|nr:DnaA regulatory inactivator Hda [Gammaproteobacteria bacterium]
MSKQLILDLKLKETHTLNNYITGNNQLLLMLLNTMAQKQGEQQLFIWGETGVGKSHLMQAACHLASENNYSVSYLPLDQLINYSPQLLDGIESIDLICIDDVEQVIGKPEWQEQLFNLINRVRETRNHLLFSASLPPNEMALQLEDLRSRLNWGPVISIQSLADDDLHTALQQRARNQGFELPDNVCSYMLKHYARDMSGLFDKLKILEHASLAQQRLITVPFVKEVIGL